MLTFLERRNIHREDIDFIAFTVDGGSQSITRRGFIFTIGRMWRITGTRRATITAHTAAITIIITSRTSLAI